MPLFSPLRRRHALAGGAVGAAAVTAAILLPGDRSRVEGDGAADPRPAPLPPPDPGGDEFRHGVASGDPGPESVVLWTRVTPASESTPGSGLGPRVTVDWEVARDPQLADVVARGRAETGAERDHTVKLSVAGLQPETWYYYRFTYRGLPSRVGRTRTAPADDTVPERLRLGFVSCANAEHGWFGAYRYLAQRRDLHAVVHLGDYLYESSTDDPERVRTHDPARELLSLADYRRRHAQYKRDRDLADLHAALPVIAVWDDHESADGAYRSGASNHTADGPDGEGSWARRRARAHRAYDEWMPALLDETAALDDGSRLFRSVRFGRLADLHLLDLRSYRSRQADSTTPAGVVDDPGRTITGRRQLTWLKESLTRGRSRWQLVANPVLMAPVSFAGVPQQIAAPLARALGGAVSADGVPLNSDAWDGYTADRRELFAHLRDEGIEDVCFLTGDIHSGLAAELPLDRASYPDGPTAGVELVCTSVTSDNLDDLRDQTVVSRADADAIADGLRSLNPYFRYANLVAHGCCVLDVTPERVQCDWWVVDSRQRRDARVSHDFSVACRRGNGRLEAVNGPV